jgi:hypothetical protein
MTSSSPGVFWEAPHPLDQVPERERCLCRDLCRNPAIPTQVVRSRSISLGATNRRVRNSAQTSFNTAPQYHSGFFGVVSSRRGLRIRNDEVVGSIPTSSTILLNNLHPGGSCCYQAWVLKKGCSEVLLCCVNSAARDSSCKRTTRSLQAMVAAALG